jgi:hypothetical protein
LSIIQAVFRKITYFPAVDYLGVQTYTCNVVNIGEKMRGRMKISVVPMSEFTRPLALRTPKVYKCSQCII